MKIAFLNNYTADFIVKDLKSKLTENKIEHEFYLPGFNQFVQEIVGENSGLYKFNPEVVFFSVDLGFYCTDIIDEIFNKTNSQIYDEVHSRIRQLFDLISMLKSKLPNTKVFVDNFYLSTNLLLGTLEFNGSYGLANVPIKLNLELEEFANTTEGIKIIDIYSLILKYGDKQLFDPRLYYVAKSKWSREGLDKVSSLYLSHIKAYKGLRKKCIVLDLDNTLWGGVIGQDGMEGIALSNDGTGKAFYDFQKELLKLYKQGIILAVCSKNSEDVAMEAITKHPYMILKPEHFAATRINWENKAQNIKEIAKELNIGLDSLVFFDDSSFERGLVKQEIPEVAVPDLPEDPIYYVDFLKSLDFFNYHVLTSDDFKRNKTYQANKERRKLEASFTDTTSFLRSLEMEVKIKNVDDFSFPRAMQLVQKTNQFNVTTRRHSENEMRAFYSNPNYTILEMSVKDKFGDNGIVGTAILKLEKEENRMCIDSFIMSCRVIGRNVESAFLSYIAKITLEKGVTLLGGEVVPTPKNEPCRDIYKRHNFENVQDGFWMIDLSKNKIECPDYIKLN